MSTFIHLRRRKLGCVLLAVVIALTGAWVRSYVVCDEIGFIDAKGDLRQIASVSGWIVFLYSSYEGDNPPAASAWYWQTISTESFIGGVDCSSNELPVPYGLFAVPVMLVSAYLILSKLKAEAVRPRAEMTHA